MAITKQKKEEIVEDLKDKFKRSKIVIFVDYTGLDVKGFESVRSELKKEGVELRVAKKTLFDRVFGDNKVRSLDGQIAASFGFTDEVMPAKIIHKMAGELENLKIVAGIVDGEFVGVEHIVTLAKVPSREELLARAVGSINAPISGFVNVLVGNIRGLVQVLNQVAQK